MAFKRYNLNLVLLIILVVVTSLALGWAVFSLKLHLTILLSIGVVTGAVMLFHYLSRTNREILFFFKALKNDDTSFRYPSDHRNRIIDELHHYLNTLNMSFREMKIDNDLREKYFSRILENLSSGLMVISKTGHVNHINSEALRLFGIPQLTHIKALSGAHPYLYTALKDLNSMEKKEFSLQAKEIGVKRVLGLQALEVNLKGEDVRIITVQDLSLEMERKEIDDWIRLIRVMSHEIMNSLAPITSISTTLKEVWEEDQAGQPESSDPKIRQTLKGLDAIAEQSEGLTTFFESYRVLSRIPDPVMRDFPVLAMFGKLETLVIHNEENQGVSISFMCEDPDLNIHADEQMITQVMLNLIKNAGQALKGVENPAILVQAERTASSPTILRVIDNGPGIPGDIANEIFMPFFTTRQKGTGVGLSYSRQVMNMNNGKIEFDSVPGKTEFKLVL